MGLLKLNIIENIPIKLNIGKRKAYRHNHSKNRDNLYIKLAKIIKLFPDYTPADILYSSMNGDTPCFRGDYDSVIKIINIKIENAQIKLESAWNLKQKENVKIEISNWKHMIEKLEENKRVFDYANTLYEMYKKKHSGQIELLFSQEVRNKMVGFNVFINNAFGMPGHLIKEDDVYKNKNDLIFTMRRDIGMI